MNKRRAHGEGSIYRRPDGRWVGMLNLGIVAGKRKRRAYYGQTQEEVLGKLARLVDRRRARAHNLFGELAYRRLEQGLLFGQLEIHGVRSIRDRWRQALGVKRERDAMKSKILSA